MGECELGGRLRWGRGGGGCGGGRGDSGLGYGDVGRGRGVGWGGSAVEKGCKERFRGGGGVVGNGGWVGWGGVGVVDSAVLGLMELGVAVSVLNRQISGRNNEVVGFREADSGEEEW